MYCQYDTRQALITKEQARDKNTKDSILPKYFAFVSFAHSIYPVNL